MTSTVVAVVNSTAFERIGNDEAQGSECLTDCILKGQNTRWARHTSDILASIYSCISTLCMILVVTVVPTAFRFLH